MLGLGDPNIDEAPFFSCSSSLGSSWAQSVVEVANIVTFSTLEVVIIQHVSGKLGQKKMRLIICDSNSSTENYGA